MDQIKQRIRCIPDFPKPGVMFRDITTLLKDPEGMKLVTDAFLAWLDGKEIDAIAGIEARGFIFGGILAGYLQKGFIPIRKQGKLPAKTESITYDLEYGTDTLEIHADAVLPGDRIVIVDDLVATGGTMFATCQLIERVGGVVVECLTIIDLPDLGGSEKIRKQYSLYHLVEFAGE